MVHEQDSNHDEGFSEQISQTVVVKQAFDDNGFQSCRPKVRHVNDPSPAFLLYYHLLNECEILNDSLESVMYMYQLPQDLLMCRPAP